MFKLKVLVLVTLLLFAAVTDSYADAVGKITQQTGLTELQRNKSSTPTSINTEVEMDDTIVTAKSKTRITFKDDSLVEVNEQSKLLIDSFVYDDSARDAGKLGMKVALGTARFASGQLTKHDPESVKIETPSATIGVRGTDFTLTVDELGRTLAILLPSCPLGFKDVEKDCVVGEISINTGMGTTILNKAFQSASVASRESKPTAAVILDLNPDQINNLLIVTPPKIAKEKLKNTEKEMKTALDINFLDQKLLDTSAMLEDALVKQGNALDIQYLDNSGFMINMLDLLNSQLLDDMLNATNTLLPKYPPNKAAGLHYLLVDTNLTLYRVAPSHIAQVNVDKDSPSTLTLNQDGVTIVQNVNNSNGTKITINQSK
jgi:FecR protein